MTFTPSMPSSSTLGTTPRRSASSAPVQRERPAALALALVLGLLVTGCCCCPPHQVVTPTSLTDSPRRIMDRSRVRVTTVYRSSERVINIGDGSRLDRHVEAPCALAVEASGNVYVADITSRLLMLDPSKAIHVVAGLAVRPYDSLPFVGSFADGLGPEGRFNYPKGLAVDASGNAIVADTGNHRIRKVTPDGNVTTLAGSGTPGGQDGAALSAQFNQPCAIVLDASGSIYVAEAGGGKVRRIAADGSVTTLAGTGEAGFADGPALESKFGTLRSIALGPDGSVYVGDEGNSRIRRIYAGTVSTVAGSGMAGLYDGPAMSARFGSLGGLVCAQNGDLIVADSWNACIRRIAVSGEVTTIVGGGDGRLKGTAIGYANGEVYADGDGTTAMFGLPNAIASDAAGDLFVGDYANNAIRKITFEK